MSSLSKNQPLISVIVPVYNILEYLPRCVASITNQTWQNLEILLVNDGSTDGTGALCDELAEKDSRIKVFHKQNGGSSSARNLGIEKAIGEYLGFVDSDDYIEPDMYERLADAALKYDASIVQIGRNEVDEEGNALPDICIPPKETECIDSPTFLKELLMHRGDCSFCTKLIRRECFAQRKFPVGVLNEDFHLLIQMLTGIDRVISLPGYGYHVFYRIGSNTRKENKNNFSRVFADSVDNADVVLDLVKEQYPELVPVAYRFGVFQRLEYLLHIPIGQMERRNRQYREIVGWLRSHWCMAMRNPILTAKNKVYHTLFAIAPKGVRVIHKFLRRL